jgi:hypothetical protein
MRCQALGDEGEDDRDGARAGAVTVNSRWSLGARAISGVCAVRCLGIATTAAHGDQ